MVDVHTVPSTQQVLEIPAHWTDEVRPEWIDMNGHMNIRHYVDAGGFSTDRVCRDAGIDDEYRAQRRLGVFTAEQHLTYLHEMHLGTPLSAHVRVLDRSAKVCHMMALIMDRRVDRLACIYETVLVHVGMDTRRPAEFPADIAEALGRSIADQANLEWPAPLCGALGIRR